MESLNKFVKDFGGKVGFVFRKCIFSVLSVGRIPNHMAFIMDGNRRYARKHKLKEGSGHRVGFLALMAILKYCYELGVKYITVYAFSVDNFNRQPEEVQSVMDLMREKIEELLREESIVIRFGVRINFIGNLKLLDESTRKSAEKAMTATAKNNNVVLNICVAYSSSDEITHAIQECYNEKRDKLLELAGSGSSGSDLTELHFDDNDREFAVTLSDIERHMYMSMSPEPDILIRTSGANRLSNFLLWQTTYTYLYSPAALWPDISLWHLIWAVLNFQRVESTLEKKKKKL